LAEVSTTPQTGAQRVVGNGISTGPISVDTTQTLGFSQARGPAALSSPLGGHKVPNGTVQRSAFLLALDGELRTAFAEIVRVRKSCIIPEPMGNYSTGNFHGDAVCGRAKRQR
jgi:hypothetical protein